MRYAPLTVTVETPRGTFEASGTTRTWMCHADLVRYHRTFDDIPPRADALDDLTEDHRLFFAWRWLGRHLQGLPRFRWARKHATRVTLRTNGEG